MSKYSVTYRLTHDRLLTNL